MQLIITDTASKWFQHKYNLVSGDGIKLYGKTIQPHNVKHGPKQGYEPESTLDEATIVITEDGINILKEEYNRLLLMVNDGKTFLDK